MTDSAMPGKPSSGWSPDLVPEHIQELEVGAVLPTVASDQGVYSATSADRLPETVRWIHEKHGDRVLPALVYPMTLPDGSISCQVKPSRDSVTSVDGRSLKYVGPSRKNGHPPELTVVRTVDGSSKVLIVEGVKQALAAASWASAAWSIYRITGIHSWLVRGDGEDDPSTPTPYLDVVLGCDVIIIADADARTNFDVYHGAKRLGDACLDFGAKSVRFGRVPGVDKDGLDDVLGRLPTPDKRRGMLDSILKQAAGKPADLTAAELSDLKAQKARRRARRALESGGERAEDGRLLVDTGGDPLALVDGLVRELITSSGTPSYFNHAGAIVKLDATFDADGSSRIAPVQLDMHRLRYEILSICDPYAVDSHGRRRHDTVHDKIVGMVMGRHSEFPVLSGITRSPFVTGAGEVVTAAGYHEGTRTYLDPSKNVRDLEVPLHPTDADIAASVALLRDDLFEMDGVDGRDGWIFKGPADQTNALSHLLTVMVRPAVPLVPLFVVDGVQRGVGKGGLIEAIDRIAYGVPARFEHTPASDEEMDKRLYGLLRSGAEKINLDEVQAEDGSRLHSKALTAALTTELFGGRLLGRNDAGALRPAPNRATWAALGNNVEIPSDMARRVYTCRLESDREDLEERDNFRHPNLHEWISANRGALVRAALILIRAWYDRGQPAAPREFGFKGFGEWQRVVGGICHLAGLEGFLATVLQVRQEADLESTQNGAHIRWLDEKFPSGQRFAARDVTALIRADPDVPTPFGISREKAGDAQYLSRHYGRSGRWYQGLRVIRDEKELTGGVRAYRVEHSTAARHPTSATVSAVPTSAATATIASRPAAGVAPGETIQISPRKGYTSTVARLLPPMAGLTITELGKDPA